MSLKLKFLKLITSLDTMGDPIAFTINKETSPKSMMGGIISSIIMILMIFLFLNGVMIPLKKLNPIFNSHYIIDEEKSSINLSLDTMPFAFQILDSYRDAFEDDNYKLYMTAYLDYYDPIKQEWDYKYFNLTDCPEEYFSKFNINYTKKELNVYKCIDNQNFTVTGGDTNDADTFKIIVTYCDMDWYDDPSSCNLTQKKNAFKEKYANEGMYFSFKFINNMYNPTFFKPPIDSYVDEIYSYIDPNFYKETSIRVANHTLITDDGLIWENQWNTTILTSDKIEREQVTSNDEENTLIKFRIWKSDRKYLINRSYARLQSVLAGTLGLYTTISLIAKIVIGIITKTRFNIKIMNQIFEFELDKSEEKETKTNKIQRLNDLVIPKNKKFEIKSEERLEYTNMNLNKEEGKIFFNLIKKGKKELEINVTKITEKYEKNIFQQEDNTTKNIFENNIKRNRYLVLSNREVFKMVLFPCFIKSQKFKKRVDLYKLAKEKMQSKFEIAYIMKRLEEVEKLKTLIIPKKQISFFESVAKELCSLERNEKYSHHPKIKIFKNNNERKKTDKERLKEKFGNKM